MFTLFYVQIDNSIVEAHRHNETGTEFLVSRPDFMSDVEYDSSAFFEFRKGLSVNVEFSNGIIKLTTEDEVRVKDLKEHGGWANHKENLVKLYIRHILGTIANSDEIKTVCDYVMENLFNYGVKV